MVHFSPSIEQRQKHFIIAKLTLWVWCGVAIMNGQIVLHVYRRLLTNRLHGKYLANSRNYRVILQNISSKLIASTARVLFLSHGVGEVLL